MNIWNHQAMKTHNSSFDAVLNFYKPFLHKYKSPLCCLFFMPIIWCLAETIAPYLIKIIIDEIALQPYTEYSIINTLIQAGIGYTILMVIMELALRLCNFIWIQTIPKLKAEIREKALELFENQSFDFFNTHSLGKLITKYRNLSHCLERSLSHVLYGIFPTIISSFIAFLFILNISPIFAYLFGGWYVGMNFMTYIFSQKSFGASNQQTVQENKLIGYVGDLFRNQLARRISISPYDDKKIFQKLQKREIQKSKNLEWVSFKIELLRSVLSVSMLIFMIMCLIFGWKQDLITLGDFSFVTAVCFYARRSAWVAAIELLGLFKELGIAAQSLVDLSPQEKPSSRLLSSALTSLKGGITIYNLNFSYENKEPLFTNFNLKIKPGEKIAITGPSGIGKSSLIQLLLGFYELESGKILFDTIEHKSLTQADRGYFISYVPQTTSLFHRSILQNISYGTPKALYSEIIEVAKQAQCHDFITSFPKHYETIVGEEGTKLSGGQRQRIAIAQALLRKNPILILDEAFSALDYTNETKILTTILNLYKDKTVILISHRETSIKKMDRIISLKPNLTNTNLKAS